MFFSRALYALLATTVLGAATPALALKGDRVDRTNMVQTFGDEFNNFSWYAEDSSGEKGGGTWRTNYGYKWTNIDDRRNHTLVDNGEEQLYVDKGFRGSCSTSPGLNPFSIKQGVLQITAERSRNSCLYGYKYTSGLITSEATFTQTYGYFEMRAKLPAGRGLWPAFWLLPADKSWPPEIDIMEILSHDLTTLYTTLHTNETGTHTKSDIPATKIPNSSFDFHTYAVDWGPQETVFYFDDKEIGRRPTPADMNKPFFLLINLAVGGYWPGSPTALTKFPATYQVDWVRVWQRPSYTNGGAITGIPSTTGGGGTTTTSPTPKPAPTPRTLSTTTQRLLLRR